MKHPTDPGMNRTGIDLSPIDAKELISASRAARPTSEGDEQTLAAYRSHYIQEAEPIGTVPVPGTLKGLAQTVMQKVTGKKPEVLIDKLGERLAFERTGTRLYDAFLNKCQIKTEEARSLPLDQLRIFRDEEARHFALLWDVMRDLGADPTAQTPCADTSGVASMGLMQVITDPRTSLDQSLHALHIAELADHDGWELLITLTTEMGLDDVAGHFRQAYAEEERHLQTIRQLMATCIRTEAGMI
jgi:rubrerythrin